ncbi:DUF5132 domain-containing protein [Aneurinibacillus sp. Ricciae_BoGa-3]|uniref:DUF5132 domain-containing protein n=1 Tax=Aneurinibacillus sp. Ricciae_BoGa-3 TaxID=3022697 RepID=UPI0023418114|nr:DUF5132 domain-containing protein [Aneurinibacillus sp. Ricciae_BoGa-3]WCK54716.1 DUF5132 domain-containing protein [Aneurinibacillus sp. Ricciae_BoGa-3]
MNVNIERVVVGAALLVAAPVLLPIIREAGNIGAKTTATAWSGLRTTTRRMKEELEDIVAEAQFERLKKRVEKEIY